MGNGAWGRGGGDREWEYEDEGGENKEWEYGSMGTRVMNSMQVRYSHQRFV
jgi:hypothetical protein